MPKVIFVKKAQKPNSVVSQADIDRANAGEEGAASYYHWSFKTAYSSIRRESKTSPRQSQLTMSEFWSNVYALQEEVEDACLEFDDLDSFKDDIVSRIREIGEECREKFDNLPEGLQQGSTGELLEERADSCESAADEIDSIDIPSEDDFDEEKPEDETSEAFEQWEADFNDWKENQIDEVISQISDALSNVQG